MFYLEKIISSILTPPGIIILMLLIIPLIILKKTTKTSVKWLSFVLFVLGIFFYVISTGIGTLIYLRPLELMYVEPSKIEGDVIVILGGGINFAPGGEELSSHTLARVMKGYEVYEKTRKNVIVTGAHPLGRDDMISEAEIMKETLCKWGIPSYKIIVDSEAKNTFENSLNTQKICSENNWSKIILVTSAVHMSRAISLFHNLGIEVVPVPTDYRYDHTSVAWPDFLPSGTALDANLAGIHEYLGQIWYSTKTASFER